MIRRITATGILVLMVAALSGVIVYRWQEDRFGDERMIMTEKIDELSSEVQQLQEARQLAEALEKCGELNAEPAHATVAYSNAERGISVDLPYNERWGYGENLPEPYQMLSGIDGILFGPPQELDICRWAHTYQLTFIPTRTEDEIAEDVLKRNAKFINEGTLTAQDTVPETRSINGLTVYTYEVPGLCPSRNFEIAGEEFNYIFTACKGNDKKLESIVESVELL